MEQRLNEIAGPRHKVNYSNNYPMKLPPLGTLGLAAILIGCGGPAVPKASSSPLPSKPRISTLRLTIDNRIKHQVSLEPMFGFRSGGSFSLGPPEKLQKTEEKTSSKVVDLDLFNAPSEMANRSEGDVYLVHILVSPDGKSANGPEAYVAVPPRIAENAGAKGGQMAIADKGIELTVAGVTLYAAWIPPESP